MRGKFYAKLSQSETGRLLYIFLQELSSDFLQKKKQTNGDVYWKGTVARAVTVNLTAIG